MGVQAGSELGLGDVWAPFPLAPLELATPYWNPQGVPTEEGGGAQVSEPATPRVGLVCCDKRSIRWVG